MKRLKLGNDEETKEQAKTFKKLKDSESKTKLLNALTAALSADLPDVDFGGILADTEQLLVKKTKIVFLVASKLCPDIKVESFLQDRLQTLAFVLQNYQLQKNSQITNAMDAGTYIEITTKQSAELFLKRFVENIINIRL